MTEGELIEKVARALCEIDGRRPDDDGPGPMLPSTRNGNTITAGGRPPLWHSKLEVAKHVVALFDLIASARAAVK